MTRLRITALLFVLLLPLSAQEQQKVQPKDTSLRLLRTEAIPPSLEQPIVILPLSFALSTPGEGTVQPLYYIFGESPEQFSWNRSEKTDIASPWKIYLEEQKKNSTWRSVLGSVQLGGVAYIAYRHIKKYGLFK